MNSSTSPRAVVVGAGMGGLAAAIALASEGIRTLIIERAGEPGGKMRQVEVGGARIDAGPTVLTMRWVFDRIFEAAGSRLEDHLVLHPAEILARHAWSDRERLDLFATLAQSHQAIAEFSSRAEADRYLEFCKQAKRTYEILEQTFITSSKPSLVGLIGRAGAQGLVGLKGLTEIRPYTRMWTELGKYFQDRRLRQLFGRYATYNGSSPFEAPATLMLIAHVERSGVWLIEGGMHRLAQALAQLATRLGVEVRYDTTVTKVEVAGGRIAGVVLDSGERLPAAAVVVNADAGAIAAGLLGPGIERAVARLPISSRSLSAVTVATLAHSTGFPLVRHNVFFGPDSVSEFQDLFERRRLPSAPTVYLCAQDRDATHGRPVDGPERLLAIVNAPATGDLTPFRPEEQKEIEQCVEHIDTRLRECGLALDWSPQVRIITQPRDFERMFPGSGGALYGQVSHGWQASFQRPSARTSIPGLYLAGGSTHPGAGVPMAAMSGCIAAASIIRDRHSIGLSHRAAMPGGTSMRSLRIAGTD